MKPTPLVLSLSLVAAFAQANAQTLSSASAISVVASTIPSNGDVNPYGVARVPVTTGRLTAGHILVSNFNDVSNLQGTGSTIVDVAPTGTVTLFAQIDAATLPASCPGGVGLTTALAVLRSGWVVVGSLPTKDGTSATAQAGCLIVLDSTGNVSETISGTLINGPWDMAALDQPNGATLFVTNVLNGTLAGSPNVVNRGSVVRIGLTIPPGAMPRVRSIDVIAFGFPERTDPAALVIGPTGLQLAAGNTLYVADSLSNRIAAIPDALTRRTSAGIGITVAENGSFNDPLGLALGPRGNIATVNGNNGLLIVTRPDGTQLLKALLDKSGTPPGAGALFGLAFAPEGLYFVDDVTNTLNLLH